MSRSLAENEYDGNTCVATLTEVLCAKKLKVENDHMVVAIFVRSRYRSGMAAGTHMAILPPMAFSAESRAFSYVSNVNHN